MKAVIYTRVSTREQATNLSLGTQLKACRAYCEREGYGILKEFTDAGESAKTTDRPEFQDLLEFCRLHKRDVHFLVFYNISRLSRNAYDFAVIQLHLRRLGVSLRSVNEPIDDEPSGRLMGNVMAAFAQFENDAKASRTKAGMRAAIELGRWPFKAPMGYLSVPGQPGVLQVDPVRGPLVRAAFEDFSTGRFSKAEVLRRVLASGLRTERGKPLTAQSVGSLFRNPIYMGWLTVERWGLSTRGDFEPLVSDATFRRVQLLLSGKSAPVKGHSRNHPDFPLRRFVTCANCSTGLTGSWSSGRSQKYAYYHCPKCRRVKAPKGQLESAFTDLVSRLVPKPEYIALFNAIVLDVWRDRQDEAIRVRTRLERVIEDKRSRLDRIDEAFLFERSIDRQAYERQRDLLREALTLTEMELNDAVLDQLDVEGLLAFAEHLLGNAASIWLELGIDQRQQFQRVLFPEGLVFDGESFGTAVTCLALTQLRGVGEEKSGLASPRGTRLLYSGCPLTGGRGWRDSCLAA
jgi:DNA invertase Pin-like site-specific DNA recombinase